VTYNQQCNVACPQTKTPKGHFGASLFYLIIFISYSIPLLVSCLALWTSPYVTRQFGRWFSAWRTGQGTNKYDLCIRSMWL